MSRKIILIFGFVCTLIFTSARVFASDYKSKITVAKDGSGDFTSIEKAIESCKSFPDQRITIFIKNGVYKEKVIIPSWNTKISLIGQNKDSTIISFGDYFGKINKGPNSTFYTATLLVQANDFHAENLTIENSAGPIGQAVALDVEGDRCSFINCRLLGNQDTVYASGENFRQYFKDCYITGTTDFIFGEATALFEDCEIVCKANSYITAASTPENTKYGFVFRNCTLKALAKVTKVFLGRPWRKYANVVYLECNLGKFIAPEGWQNWSRTENYKTVFYAEYHNKGEGSNLSARVSWAKQLTQEQANQYTVKNFLSGNDNWNPLAN